jgi:arabinogalactan endo-1,4-beta-galactosidase
MGYRIALLMIIAGVLFAAGATEAKKDLLVGVDANYSLELLKNGTTWRAGDKPEDLFALLHAAGINSFRVRVWTNDAGSSGKDYAIELAKKAQQAGLQPYPVFFLSENWSDYVKQPAPALWQKLTFDEKLKAITRYSHDTAQSFKDAGITTDIYEIGNEIDFGICGEFAENWGDRFSMEYMQARIWNKAAQIIAAAEEGIREVNPRARFLLHLTQWWNPAYCTAFIHTMIQHSVQIDLFGLSFYPSSGLDKKKTFSDLAQSVKEINDKTGLPIIICECGYPSTPTFGGQFATWNKEVPGFPLSERGQRKWIAQFIAMSKASPSIVGVFYWSPELYTQELWSAFSLFRADGRAKEGLRAFK